MTTLTIADRLKLCFEEPYDVDPGVLKALAKVALAASDHIDYHDPNCSAMSLLDLPCDCGLENFKTAWSELEKAMGESDD